MTAFHLLIGIILAVCATWLIYDLYRATRFMRRGRDELQLPDEPPSDSSQSNQAAGKANTVDNHANAHSV
ncbi:MAG: hypothetical protein IKR25_10650 [Muribaculaceae bacterium]|nr:hypothetical protein [Muribaculaceae bacterium]